MDSYGYNGGRKEISNTVISENVRSLDTGYRVPDRIHGYKFEIFMAPLKPRSGSRRE